MKNDVVSVGKRVSAFLLDIFLVYILISLISTIKFINPNYDKFEEAYNAYNEIVEDYYDEKITLVEMNEQSKEHMYNISKYSVSTNIAALVIIFAYFGLFQKYNNGQTLGKKIMKIKVVGNDDNDVSLGRFILRIIPIYYIFIGNVISISLNSILVFLLSVNKYYIANSIIVYLLFGVGIVSFIMMITRKDKRGLQDLIAGTKVVFE